MKRTIAGGAGPWQFAAMYRVVLATHISLVLLSGALFMLRGSRILAGRPVTGRVWRVLPHALDTLLLACGAWLAFMLHLNPLHVPWLGVKLLMVVVYILVGAAAFRASRPDMRKALFWAALAVYAFVASIAVLHDPRGVFALASAATGG